MAINVILDTGNTFSTRISRDIPSETIVRVKLTNVKSRVYNGSTDYGKLEFRFLDVSNNVISTKTVNLYTGGGGNNYTVTHSGYTTPITKADFRITTTGLTGNDMTRIDFTGEFELYLAEYDKYWLGFIQPDQLTRSLVNASYFISLSAVDGLLDLKSIDYPLSGVTGYRSQIEVIKSALQQIGIDELDIATQLNINNNTDLLGDITENSYRFRNVEGDGRTTYWNCWDVLDRTLALYNAKLFQSNGLWQIITFNEVDSYVTRYAWDDLATTTTTRNRLLDVSDSTIQANSDQLSKVRPVKQMNIKLLNYYWPENPVTNAEFTNDITGWNNAGGASAWYSFIWQDGRLKATMPPSFGDPNVTHSFTSDDFTLTPIGTGNTVTVSIDADLVNVVYDTGSSATENPDISLQLYRGAILTGSTTTQMQDGNTTYSFTANLPVSASASDYHIKINVIPNATEDYLMYQVFFDNALVQVFYPDDIVFDRYYIATNTGTTAIKILDKTIYFADGTASEIAKLKEGGVDTNVWSNYGASEHLPLQELLAYNRLRLSSAFKNYIRFTIRTDEIQVFNVLEFLSKQYNIVNYSFDLRANKLTVDCVELLTDTVGMNFQQQNLNSVDGQLE